MKLQDFKSKAQFKKYNDIKEYVERLISLQLEGIKIYSNGELVKGKFGISDEDGSIYEQVDNCRFIYIGSEHCFNPKTKEYDILWVSQTLKQFKKENNFQICSEIIDIE